MGARINDSDPISTTCGARRPPKARQVNPIELVLQPWVSALPPPLLDEVNATITSLTSAAPRRWVVYAPMLLLPSGSFADPLWAALLTRLDPQNRGDLWHRLLQAVSKKEGKGTLTHLAVNAGIPLHKEQREGDNVLRTPSGLLMLHGNFGPALSPDLAPSEDDFENAFWVSTKQNGISQVWAPRYTMFSRGNVKEKARLLAFHNGDGKRMTREEGRAAAAVDLYAGIGYFVFSYVKLGLGKVLGWELNPWSVEGLRRGAVANGWEIKIVRRGDEAIFGTERIVVFLEDNQMALGRVGEFEGLREIMHINGGLLPTSKDSWEMASKILPGTGWLHVHENVGADDVRSRKGEIEATFRAWLKKRDDRRLVKIEHVELVKTFAPGVWHCVFDVYLQSSDHDAA